MKQIHVAVGVIIRGDEIFIAKRGETGHQAGKWEFPGGKVESGETTELALARELKEEIGIHVTACQPFMEIRHEYPDKHVFLDIWTVTAFTGTPHGAEGQSCHWVKTSELSNYEFPEANIAIINALQSSN